MRDASQAAASVLSAWGMLTSDLRYDVSHTHLGSSGRIRPNEVREIFAKLEQQALSRLRSWFNGPIAIERSAEMRYGEQIFEIDVPLDGLDMDSPSIVDQIEERFHRRHEDLYTYSSPDQEVVFVNARVSAVGAVKRNGYEAMLSPAAKPCIPKSSRKAFFGEWREVPVYALEALAPGHALEGPAIIEAETTTVIVNSGDRVAVNDLGWLDIQLA